MPTNNYQADWKVEIAFDGGVNVPAASWTWTDVSPYVELAEGINISWGRGDERSTADANQLSLTLDNSDGRFTWGKTAGAYYPDVKVSRPIRVLADPVDGAQVTYFQGFVNGWPTEWDDTDAYAKATISASSRLSRIGTQASLKSIVEETILADSPAAYYTLSEPADATRANDSSGNKADPLTLAGDLTYPVVFGTATGPGTDGLTAAQFADGQYLAGSQIFTPSTGFTIEAFVSAPAVPASGIDLISYLPEIDLALFVAATGKLAATVKTSGTTRSTVTSSADVIGGDTHHAAAKWDGSTLTLYLDGSVAGTSAAGSASLVASSLSVGGGSIDVSPAVVGDNPVDSPLTGVVAHAAVYTTLLADAQVLSHASAGLTGYAGETTSARLIRYADLAGIPSAEVDAETGSTTMQHVDTTDQQVVELMRVVETTEGGVLYDERDGTLTFHNRAHRYTASSAYTLNMAEQEVEAGYAPRVDLVGLANDVTAQDITGRYTAHVFDDDSIEDNGSATASIETASEDDDEPLNLASWNLLQFKEPAERVPNLEVDALAQVGKTPNCSAVLATTVGTKITVSNRPSQASSSTVDYFVEGGTATIGPESLKLTFNVSPSAPYDQVLIIDDPVRGAIGVYPLAL